MAAVAERLYSDAKPEGEIREAFTTRILSPLEHKLIGSTPWSSDGASIDVDELIEQAHSNPDALVELLTPLEVSEGSLTPSAVAEKRQEVGVMRGAVAVLDEDQRELWHNHMAIQLVPAPMRKNTKTIKPEWGLQIVDDRRQPINYRDNPSVYKRMHIAEAYQKHFTLHVSPKRGYSILRFVP